MVRLRILDLFETLDKLSRILNVSVGDLFEQTDDDDEA